MSSYSEIRSLTGSDIQEFSKGLNLRSKEEIFQPDFDINSGSGDKMSITIPTDTSISPDGSLSSINPAENGSRVPHTHVERHAGHGPIVRDMIIGFADGLTVPFALTAGLSSLGSSNLVIISGLAELCAGSISMGLGAWAAAIGEKEHYNAEEKREYEEVANEPDEETEEIYEIMGRYGVSREAAGPMVEALKQNPDQWVSFMMDNELKLEKPETSRAWISAITMGFSYFFGGFIPLTPYIGLKDVHKALFTSVGITVFILLVFGYLKTRYFVKSEKAALKGALQMVVVGALAAGTSYGIVRAINHARPVQF
ncbi:MAG: hypothetical protein M1827_005836 [Pycnora praestabilis]|nr:MAG: hypothetical protein M1827_005836 [Pycnora praestabilis]